LRPRRHVVEIEAEIAEVEQAEKALPPLAGAEVHVSVATVHGSAPHPSYFLKGSDVDLVHSRHQQFAQMTIKQLVMQALHAKHPDGFDTTQLREFIRDAYNRAIAPDSLRPQLLRLKSDNWIEARENVWYLTKWALVHDHPRSMNVNDEPSESDTANMIRVFTEAATALGVDPATEKPKPKK
jgi:hypothetical protein